MTELVREVFVEATPEVIFQYLVDAKKYEEWSGSKADLDPRPGGIHRAVMGGSHLSEGEFLEIDQDSRVLFSFGWAEPDHPIPPGSTTVEIALLPDERGTTVRLIHRGLPENAVGDHSLGWDHYLARLKVVVTGGEPGPDEMG